MRYFRFVRKPTGREQPVPSAAENNRKEISVFFFRPRSKRPLGRRCVCDNFTDKTNPGSVLACSRADTERPGPAGTPRIPDARARSRRRGVVSTSAFFSVYENNRLRRTACRGAVLGAYRYVLLAITSTKTKSNTFTDGHAVKGSFRYSNFYWQGRPDVGRRRDEDVVP